MRTLQPLCTRACRRRVSSVRCFTCPAPPPTWCVPPPPLVVVAARGAGGARASSWPCSPSGLRRHSPPHHPPCPAARRAGALAQPRHFAGGGALLRLAGAWQEKGRRNVGGPRQACARAGGGTGAARGVARSSARGRSWRAQGSILCPPPQRRKSPRRRSATTRARSAGARRKSWARTHPQAGRGRACRTPWRARPTTSSRRSLWTGCVKRRPSLMAFSSTPSATRFGCHWRPVLPGTRWRRRLRYCMRQILPKMLLPESSVPVSPDAARTAPLTMRRAGARDGGRHVPSSMACAYPCIY